MPQLKTLQNWLNSQKNLIKSESLSVFRNFVLNLRVKAQTNPVWANLVRYLPQPPIDRQEPRWDEAHNTDGAQATEGDARSKGILAQADRRVRLSDAFVPLMAYVQEFSGNPTGSAEALSERLSKMIADASIVSLNQGFSANDFNDALFPVLAWVDERISLLQPWEGAHAWQNYLLQRLYFRTTLAGVDFFERLEDLDPTAYEIRELFLMCLCMGFLGKYNTQPLASELTDIRVQQYRLYQEAVGQTTDLNDGQLFACGYQENDAPAYKVQHYWKRWVTPMNVAIVLVPLLIIFMLVLGLTSELNESVDAFRKVVNL